MGTLPRRKPSTFTLRARFLRRKLTSSSTLSAGTETVTLRSKPFRVSTETCISSPLGYYHEMVRKERLELSRVAPLEPKSSASTNSATFAIRLDYQSVIRSCKDSERIFSDKTVKWGER